MPELDHVRQDLSYVRELVEKSTPRRSPSGIYLLWAPVVLVGFALADFAPRATGLFWLVAAPAGFVASIWIGARRARAEGQVEAAEGTRHLLHWGALMAAIALVVPLAATGSVTGRGAGQVALLLVAFAYFLAGVHQERPLLWIGLLMGAGYLATFLVSRYVWTLTGAVIAAALVATALSGRGRTK